MGPLISPEELLEQLGEVTVLDVRWRLGHADGRSDHEAGHIPGAAFVDLEHDLADPPGAGGRHPLPGPERFAEAMRRSGVSSSRPVVVYDDAGGTSAARAWWLLRHHGHRDVRLLDGGWSWWKRVGGPVDAGPVSAAYGDFEVSPGELPVVDADEAAAIASTGLLIDARGPERFRGEVEPVDPVAGHIPGAVNVPTARNLVAVGERAGRFRSREELAAEYRAARTSDLQVAVYCGSGVTAAHDVLALEVIGVRAKLYAASWSGWITDPSRQVETGGVVEG